MAGKRGIYGFGGIEGETDIGAGGMGGRPTDAWHAHFGSLQPYFTQTRKNEGKRMLTILQKNQFPAPQSSKPDPTKISSENLIIVVNLIWDKAVFLDFQAKDL